MSCPSRCSLHLEELTFREHPRRLQSGIPGFNSEAQARFCDGFASDIEVQNSVGPIITLHGRITAREYGARLDNQGHPMIQTFPNNDAVFHDDNVPTHTAGTVRFSHGLKSMKVNFNIFPRPAQSPDLNNTEPLWSVLLTRVTNIFPLTTSLKQLEDVLQEEW
jgi:hypothetical protein